MTPFVRQLVRKRAANCCEYCRLPEWAMPMRPFHIEHIVASQHGGSDEPENLALSCDRCNVYKGTNIASIDPESKAMVPIFHPRHDRWTEHFNMVKFVIVGITGTGRATVRLLNMNAPLRVQLRAELDLRL